MLLLFDVGNTNICITTFDGNKATGGKEGSNSGGSIYATAYDAACNFELENITFINGKADYMGGGMYLTDNAVLTYKNLTFINNSAELGGGLYWDRAGVTIEDMTFNSVIAAVQTGKADIAASGITVTEERKKNVNFTIPYVTAKQVILVPVDSPIQSAADLKGKRIGVQQSTTGDIYVTENIGDPERFENSAILVATLVAGKLDAGVLDGDPAKEYVKTNPQLHILKEALTFEDYAFAISKKNPKLLAEFNKAMEEMFADGTIAKIFAKYDDKN